ncbi:MAG: energy transducer TonB [Lentimicrobiaceae bacterium]|jgi:TonB family protein|nr:energy transducer TonB [Lentimicrobiaceae bacterium]
MNNLFFKILVVCLMMSQLPLQAQISSPAEPVAGKTMTQDLIKLHMLYPEADLEAQRGGKVVLKLQIDKEGNAGNYQVVSTFSEEAASEAIRLLKQICWKPAYKNGKPIDSEQEFEIRFNAKSYKRKKEINRTMPKLDFPLATSQTIFTQNLDKVAEAFFEGEKMNVRKYLMQEIKYPEQAFVAQLSGKVVLDFVVEQDGLPSNILVRKSVGGGCDNEAIRLLKGIRWIPAVKNDSIVRSKISIEILFELGDKTRDNVPTQGL